MIINIINFETVLLQPQNNIISNIVHNLEENIQTNISSGQISAAAVFVQEEGAINLFNEIVQPENFISNNDGVFNPDSDIITNVTQNVQEIQDIIKLCVDNNVLTLEELNNNNLIEEEEKKEDL